MLKTILSGNLTADPEMKQTKTGKNITEFTVAVSLGYGENKKTEFVLCKAWDKTAEFINKHCFKGQTVLVEGRNETRSWEGTDGTKRYRTELIVFNIEPMQWRKQEEEVNVMDIPF